jgi:hypothetical protein
MNTDSGLDPVPRTLPGTTPPKRAETSQPSALLVRRRPTVRECGLGAGPGATDATRCRDITPELMIELI